MITSAPSGQGAGSPPGHQARLTTVPYQGGSCGLLLAQLRTQVGPGSRAVPGKLDGRPVLSFTIAHLFVPASTQRYQITAGRIRREAGAH
jgi:hypothetical protein